MIGNISSLERGLNPEPLDQTPGLNLLNYRGSWNIHVGCTILLCIQMANSVDPDQTAPSGVV